MTKKRVVELTAEELIQLRKELSEHCRTSIPLEEWLRGSFRRFLEARIERIEGEP